MIGKGKQVRWVFCLLFLLVGASPKLQAQGLAADLVLYNGKILTADSPIPDNFTIAEAVAVFGDRIVGVGSSQAILPMAGPQTRRIDLGGRTVIPGRVDTHTHLQNHAARRFLGQGGSTPRRNLGMTDAMLWTTKDEALAQLRTMALARQPGEWIVVQPTFSQDSGLVNLQDYLPPEFFETITLADLDRAVPNNPLSISLYVYSDGMLNSKALEQVLKHYPDLPGMVRDANGKPTGRMIGSAARIVGLNFWPDQDVKWMGDAFKKIWEIYNYMGVTTVVTRMERNPLRAFQSLDARGEMTARLAYSSESLVDQPDPEMFLRRYDTALGAGTPNVWFIGFSLINIDNVSSMGAACYSRDMPREAREFPNWRFQYFGPRGNCLVNDKNHTHRAVIEAVAKHGGRISGTHAEGDAALDEYFDVLESLQAKYNIKEKRFSIDHCRSVRKDQLERARKLDIAFTCNSPIGGDGTQRVATEIIFGPELGGEMRAPFRGMIDAGLRPSMEHDGIDEYSFTALEEIITRKYPNGRILGPGQRVTRREALYATTRWSAEYAWKPNDIGSIEVGKWADLAVLDRDYLTIPEDDISKINVLLTLLGGKIVYTEPQYATAQGLPQVGFRDEYDRSE